MIDLMLDDLSRPAGKGLDAGLELLVLVPDLDLLKPLAFPGAAQQGKTALFRFIFPRKTEILRAYITEGGKKRKKNKRMPEK